jgi:trk system potassium uptake protein
MPSAEGRNLGEPSALDLQPSSVRPGVAVAGFLCALYLVALLVGFLVLRGPGAVAGGVELGVSRAVFAVVNAGTLTGFATDVPLGSYGRRGQAAVLGLMVAGMLLSMGVGGMAVVRVLRLRFSDVQVLGAIAVLIVLGGVVGLGVSGKEAWEGLFLGVSAVGNCGLVIGGSLSWDDWRMQGVLLPLAVAGGLGITVLMEIGGRARRKIVPGASDSADGARVRGRDTPATAENFDGREAFGRGLSRHAGVILVMTAAVYLVGLLVLAGIDLAGGATVREGLGRASLGAINARTAGFGMDVAAQVRPWQWVLMGLMVVGAGSASSAGGLKLTTLAVVWLGVRQSLAGQSAGRVFGIAGVWAGLYLGVVLVTVLVLLMLEPQVPGERVLFIAISGVSNAGLSHDSISLSGPGLWVLSGGMLLGRVLPVGVLWWMAMTVREADMAVG